MFYFWLTVFLALVVFIGCLPATVRRVRKQREALRPIPPLARSDHVPCVLNTIGVVITEFFMLGLMTLAVFVGTNAALGTLGQAPDLTTGVRHLSLGVIALIVSLIMIITALVIGGAIARFVLLAIAASAIVAWMVLSSAGDQAPAILLFAALAVGVPTLFVTLLRMLF